ncbi:MAG: hypothetical protein O3B68_20885 [Planctomycetota bacterium]|nr:hypothetical protein [Planctomycetota bacterium]
MTNITYQNVTTVLLSDIPEVSGEYEREQKSWAPDDVHAHVVYGTIFAEFLRRTEEKWRNTANDDCERVLKRCFAHIEKLAASSDFETRCVVEASLLETLIGENGDWSRYSPFFGPKTSRMAEDVKRRFAGQ